jgi:Domain of unknown function (DUF1707)/Cell wall-active antibiotics response 4TMS YvqF
VAGADGSARGEPPACLAARRQSSARAIAGPAGDLRLQYLRRVTYRPAPRDLRASDYDRDRVITLLAQAAGDGRLTPDELSERVERAHQARTLGELAGLTTDLVGPDAQPIRLDGRRAVTGIFSRDSREGRWVVPESLPVVAIFGEVELDLREALLQSGRIVVYATLIAGTIHLIVPDGVSVETSGSGVFVRKINRTVRQPGPRRSPAGQYAVGQGQSATPQPVVDVRTVGFGGTIKVTSPKRPRRLGGLRRDA